MRRANKYLDLNILPEIIARLLIIFFGLFFIGVGILMLLKPEWVRGILKKAGSTVLINYAELCLRMIPGAALIVYASTSDYPTSFKVVGWFIIISSAILMILPRRLHHKFSIKCAEILKPSYFQMISPLSIFIGSILIYLVY